MASRSSPHFQPIPHPMHRRNLHPDIRSQQLPQARNKHVQTAAHNNPFVFPHRFKQEFPLQELVRIADEQVEQLGFAVGKGFPDAID